MDAFFTRLERARRVVEHRDGTTSALRVVLLPEFVTITLRARRHPDDDPTWPVFAGAGRDGQPTYRRPSNGRRSVRAVREHVGPEWMTPHTGAAPTPRSLTTR